MSAADKLANMVMENDAVEGDAPAAPDTPAAPDPTPPTPAARAEAGEDIGKMSTVDKWKGALETLRKLREAERKKAGIMAELEFAIEYRHQLAIHGLDPDDVDHILRRSYDEPVWKWQPRLKRSGDPRWQQASDRDVVGVATKDGQKIVFDEWIKPPPRKT